MNVNELLPQREIARRFNVSERTLEGMRLRREGPPFVRIGARVVRYDPAAVEAWLRECTVMPSRNPAAGTVQADR